MAEQKQPVTQQQLVNDWARITLERFREAMQREGIHIGPLYQSFVKNVLTGSGGNVELAKLSFNFYGRFVDMGVGRGVPSGSRGSLGSKSFLSKRNPGGQLLNKRRVPKKWYSRTLAAETKRLNELLADNFNITAITVFENSLKESTIDFKF